MIIGVISDSHRETKVAASAIEWLLARGADLLVHAGDIVESETLRLLRQSGKPYFAVLGNNDEALAELKNDFNLYDEPFCTEFAGLRLKIIHHPFYLFDEEPVAQNEADGLNLDADLGAGADRYVTSMDYRRYSSDESKGLADKQGISKNGTSANGRSVTADCHSTPAHQNSAMKNRNAAVTDWRDVSIDKNATVAYRQCAAVGYCHMAVNQSTLATQNLNLRHARVKSGRDLRAQKAAFRFACVVVQERKLRIFRLCSQRKEL